MTDEQILNSYMLKHGHHVFGYLSRRYIEQARKTGINTTAQDAFDAWMDWLDGQGGMPTAPLHLEDDTVGFFEAAARAMRELSVHLERSPQ